MLARPFPRLARPCQILPSLTIADWLTSIRRMVELTPTQPAFEALAAKSDIVPVYCRILSDQLTPVSAFARLAENEEHAFLFESVVGGEKIARYSFLATRPSAQFRATRNDVTYISQEGTETCTIDDPLAKLQEVLSGFSVARLSELPRFVGGAVGYAGYDVIRYYEDLPNPPTDDRQLPDVHFCIYDTLVIFDHVQKLIKIVAHAYPKRDGVDKAYQDATDRIAQVLKTLGDQRQTTLTSMAEPSEPLSYESTFEQAEFESVVDRCKEYIRAGDIFQTVVSQRLSVETDASPFDIYRALRAVNPSPFMFYLKTPQAILVGASPEILCRVEDGVVTNRPLAGTRPRGRHETEDLGFERELLADPKERAEHVMLVDLGRNDLGRVCSPKTVSIDELMNVERYAHVMHICTNLTGRLEPGKTAFDALRAVLPVGTVSGAPKIRAMEIIDELEKTRRGPYGGAVGYIDYAGNMDTCIALRTLVITESPDGKRRVFAQVGAGIVDESEPASEYRETLHKAESLLTAINIAQAWQPKSS